MLAVCSPSAVDRILGFTTLGVLLVQYPGELKVNLWEYIGIIQRL